MGDVGAVSVSSALLLGLDNADILCERNLFVSVEDFDDGIVFEGGGIAVECDENAVCCDEEAMTGSIGNILLEDRVCDVDSCCCLEGEVDERDCENS